MLKQITVDIIVDDHEPEKCGDKCIYLLGLYTYYNTTACQLFDAFLTEKYRCEQCLEEAR